MAHRNASLLWMGLILALSTPVLSAQSAQQLIQQVVDAERTANRNDHSHWIYLEDTRKPKEHTLQWVAGTQQGDLRRVIEKDNEMLPEARQREAIQKFLHDPKAQNKEVAEANHDSQQVDDLLKLLPVAFVWTQASATSTTTTLHYEPSPSFHPPTREAHVFSSMSGDLVADNQQHRIQAMHGRLSHDVTFGGGLLGKLKEGSTFSLEQQQVAPSIWQLSSVHVQLDGNAFLFKSISLQEDDERSQFKAEPGSVTLDQAAATVMGLPTLVQPKDQTARGVAYSRLP